MNGLDLFSGIGGISRALEPWVRTVAYCEQDRYAQSVLLSKMRAGELHRAPIWDDVQTLTGAMLPSIDIIFGGFPCQDISAAGRGAGLAGNRSGLFFEIIRLVEETRPAFVFLENVPAIRTRGLRQVIGAFTDVRYDCRWTCVSAAELGAPHLRKRWFLLAHASGSGSGNKSGRGRRPHGKDSTEFVYDGAQEPLADSAVCGRLEGYSDSWWGRGGNCSKTVERSGPANCSGRWAVEPDVGRVAHGIPQRVDRLRCLGNAVVPEQAREAFTRLIGAS